MNLVNWLAPTIAVIVAAFLGGVGWMIKRSVDSFEKSTSANVEAITDLYEKYNNLSDSFHELLGEHKARRKADHNGC